MQTSKLTMTQIIERLTEWKENIDCDIKAELHLDTDLNNDTRQSTQLAMAIGLLSTLGENNNINE